MPIGNIPAPKDFGTSFNEGFATSQKMFDSIANRKHQEAMVDIHQQERDQAKALLPHMIQKYQDDHSMTPLQRDHLKAQIQSVYALANVHNSNANFNNQFNKDAGLGGTETNTIPSPQSTNNINQVPVINEPNPNASSMGRRELVQAANRDQAAYDSQNNIANPAQSTQMRDELIFPVNKNQPTAPQQNQNRQVPNQNMQKLKEFIESGNAKPEEVAQVQQFIQQNEPQQQSEQVAPQPENVQQETPIEEPKINNEQNVPIEIKKEEKEEIIKKGNPNLYKYDQFAGQKIGNHTFPQIKQKIENGYEYTTLPSGKETKMKVGETSREKEFSKNDAKIAAEYDKRVMNGVNTLNTLDEISETINSPEWEKMREIAKIPIPMSGKGELFYYSHLGKPKEQKLVGDFYAKQGQIVLDVSHEFKGAFRKGEQSLVNTMKVNDDDTLAGAQGKTEALQSMTKFVVERSKLMSKLIRQGDDHTTASEKADKILKGSLIRKIANEKVKEAEKSAKESKEKSKKSLSDNKLDMVKVKDNETNKIIMMPRAEYEKLLGAS